MQEVKETWLDRAHTEGVIEGKREALLRLLTAKFGPPSSETIAKVKALASTKLDACLDRFVQAESVEDVGL